MQLIQKVYDWRDERKSDCFLQDFGSKTCMQMTQEVNNFSLSTLEKVFKKSVDKCPDSLKEKELFKGTMILALLPYDMQKKVLEEIDIMFIDPREVNVFLNRPVRKALRWAVCINKKMGDKPSYVFHKPKAFEKRILFGEKFMCELTRGQIFELSSDEAILLNKISDYDGLSNNLDVNYYEKKFKRTELVALDKLMQKGYISNVKEVERTVDIVVNNPWDYRLKLLKRVIVDIAFPLFTSYCAHQILVGVDPLESQKCITNSALHELEACGKGPYLKFEFDYIYPSGTLFKYFLIKLSDVVVAFFAHLKDLKGKSSTINDQSYIDSVASFLYKQTVPCFISFLTIIMLIRSLLFTSVKLGEFKHLPVMQLGCNIGIFFMEESFFPALKDKNDKKASDFTETKTIPCIEISKYLNNRWIHIR